MRGYMNIDSLMNAAKRIAEASDQGDGAVDEVFFRMPELKKAIKKVEHDKEKLLSDEIMKVVKDITLPDWFS